MRRSSTRYVLLGALALGGDMTGFEIRSFLDQSVRYFWRESYGQIYPELKRLAEQGLIAPAPVRGRRPDAQPWRITRAGRAALREWLDEPAQVQALRDETLLKLMFSRHASPETAPKLIDEARIRAAERLKAFEAAEKLVLSQPDDPDLVNGLAVLGRGLIMARAMIEWCSLAEALHRAEAQGGAKAVLKQWRKSCERRPVDA